MTDLLDSFLAQEGETASRCTVCKDPEVAEIIEAHLDKLQRGETTITLSVVHSGLILPHFGRPKTMDTIRAHCRRCLNRDPATGGSLGG